MNSFKEKKTKDNRILLYCGFFLISMFIALYNIKELDMITILNDEFGYWGNAAFFAKKNWNSLMSYTPYYAMGYSMILVPLMFFVKNVYMLYRSSIIVNGLLTFVCILFSYNLSNNLFGIKKRNEKAIAALFSVLSVATIFNNQVAWSEILLTTLYIILVFLIHKYEQKCQWKNLIGIGIVCFCLIEVHKRCIPIVFICVLFTVLIALREKKYKQIVFTIVFLGFSIAVYKITNKFQVDYIYNYVGYKDINNVSVARETNDIIAAFKIKEVAESAIGKVAAFSISSFFVAPIGLIIGIKTALNKIKTRSIKELSFSKAFIITCTLAMIALSVLHVHGYSRKDLPTYSRYYEFIMVPIVLLGCSYLIYDFQKNKRYLLCVIIASLFLIPIVFLATKECEGGYNVPCNPFIGAFYYLSNSESAIENQDMRAFCLLFQVSIIGGILVFQLFKNQRLLKKIVYFALVFGLTFFISWNSNSWLNGARDYFRENNEEILKYIENDNDNIYFVCMEDQMDSCIQAKYLQYVLNDRPIMVISEEELDDIQGNAWILVNAEYTFADDKYESITSSNMNLYRMRCL